MFIQKNNILTYCGHDCSSIYDIDRDFMKKSHLFVQS